MDKAVCTTSFIACGCNTAPHVLDWSYDFSLVAFGCAKNVCVIHVKHNCPPQIVATGSGHDLHVTCVKWFKVGRTMNELRARTPMLLSASADKSVIVWYYDTSLDKLTMSTRLMDHTLAVTYCTGILNTNNQLCILSSSADSTAKVWLENTEEKSVKFDCIQTLSFGRGFALCGDFVILQENVLLLCVGCDDGQIYLYKEHVDSHIFAEVLVLHGHTDWVRDVEFSPIIQDGCTVLLASCSQDCFVRVWRIRHTAADVHPGTQDDVVRLKQQTFDCVTVNDVTQYTVELETVLSGHDGWVYSVRWHPKLREGQHQLLTASLDKSMIVWAPDESGLWLEQVRVGDVGGHVSGFYGATFSPDGTAVLGHSYQGGVHMWKHASDKNIWLPCVVPSGHFAPVEDMAWDPFGQYLLSVSQDQTTRLFGVWRQHDGKTSIHELARPQVHGHDIQCLTIVNRYAGIAIALQPMNMEFEVEMIQLIIKSQLNRHCFVSGAEEKILRAFVAPQHFVSTFQTLSMINEQQITKMFPDENLAPKGASVPSLGLSNKAVYANDLDEEARKSNTGSKELYPTVYFRPVQLIEPPTEDYLHQNTLWPEVHKLYGHGFELFAVASNHQGTVLASACKASKPEHAAIILWDVATWQQFETLNAHTLTVTQLAFSPCDKYLLSVSRDRMWTLFEHDSATGVGWSKIAFTDNHTAVHTRIIWGCAWSHDSTYFATVSRDKKLVIWGIGEEKHDVCTGCVSPMGQFVNAEPLTAVHFAPLAYRNGCYLLAVGAENGEIVLLCWQDAQITRLATIDRSCAHTAAVKRLKFRPVVGSLLNATPDRSRCIQLASCGDDHAVKIHDVVLPVD